MLATTSLLLLTLLSTAISSSDAASNAQQRREHSRRSHGKMQQQRRAPIAWAYKAEPSQGIENWPSLDVAEPYDTFRQRYMTLECYNKKGSEFFETCCHPRQASRDNSDYPKECWTSSYGVLAPEDVEKKEAPKSAVSSSAPKETPKPSSSAAPKPAVAPSSSSAPAPAPPTSTRRTTTTTEEETSTTRRTSTTERTTTTERETTSTTRTTPREDPTTTTTPLRNTPRPTPTVVEEEEPATTRASSNGGGGSFDHSGPGTFFFQNGVAGACGTPNPDSRPLVALAEAVYGPLNQRSPHCGKTVTIRNNDNGQTVTAVVADACPRQYCSNPGALDLSTGAFDQIGPRSQGILNISWRFN